MTDLSDPVSVKRTVAAFLLAAVAAYIPFAAVGVFITLDMTLHPPPPPAMWGIGVVICFVIVGPICALVAGLVSAYLARYRRFHLGRLAFGILIEVSLTIVAILILVYAGALPFEL